MMQKGFTLIELLVSVAIFTVVMTISLGSLLSITSAQHKAETLKSVINNLHFALDSMSRSIRTGYDYNCATAAGGDCSGGATVLYFTAAGGEDVVYCRGAGSTCDASGAAILRSVDGAPFAPMTSSEVIIKTFSFFVDGSSRADTRQPRVTITLSGDVMVTNEQTSEFNIQTTVTQRLYDL